MSTEKRTLEFVNSQFEKMGFVLLSKEYINGKIPLDFEDEFGYKYRQSYNGFYVTMKSNGRSLPISNTNYYSLYNFLMILLLLEFMTF